MDQSKKPLVSVRLCHADIERLETLAGRLRVKESEIIRFALRLAFAKLAPLLDENAKGRDLIPIFLECGPELTYHFDLDPRTLDSILNGALDDPQKKVDSQDLELISALHMPACHPRAGLSEIPGREIGQSDSKGALQHYLYRKYIEEGNSHAGMNNRAGSLQTPL